MYLFMSIYLFYELAQEVHEIYIIRETHKPLKQVYKIAANVAEHIILVLNCRLCRTNFQKSQLHISDTFY